MFELHILTSGDPDITVVDRYDDFQEAVIGYAHHVERTLAELATRPGIDAALDLVDLDTGARWEVCWILAGPGGPVLDIDLVDEPSIRAGLHLTNPHS